MPGDHASINSQRGALMGLQSWMIKSWPIIDCLPLAVDGEWPAFLHMSTQVRQARRGSGPCAGSTVWVGSVAGAAADAGAAGYAGLAWDWVEMRPGVMLLADPNSIISNLRVVDARKAPLDSLSALVFLNTLVHRLHWQEPVCDVLAAAQGQAGGGQAGAAPAVCVA